MKILTKEEADAHYNVVLKGGVKGFVASTAVAVPLSVYLHRAWPYYRSLPISLKALGVVTLTVPVCVVKAELDGNAWERSRWDDAGKREMQGEEDKELQRWDSLSQSEKLKDWATNHRYSIVGASWAASMAGAFGYIMRDKYQTLPQKIVQARMWAQGLTVAVLIASAGLATTTPKTDAGFREDHSWAVILEEQKKARNEQAANLAKGQVTDGASA